MTTLSNTPSNEGQIVVTKREGVLVVDSRLIAEKLGIQHKSLLETLDKHQTAIEQAFGVVTFETKKPLEASKGGRPERIAYLSEDQATLLMTFSRNTAQVVECKAALVKAFSLAKTQLSSLQPPSADLTALTEAIHALTARIDKVAPVQPAPSPIHPELTINDVLSVERKRMRDEFLNVTIPGTAIYESARSVKRVLRDRAFQGVRDEQNSRS